MIEKHLQALIDVAPYLSTLFNIDFSMGIMNSEVFLFTQPGARLVGKESTGDRNEYDDETLGILKGKKTITIKNPPGHFDIPSMVTLTPVLDDKGNPTDIMIAIIKDIEKQVNSEDMTKAIFESFKEINEGMDVIDSNSQSLQFYVSEITKNAFEAQNKIGEIDAIIQAIKNITKQINLLSLNASIEAARVGSVGSGFAVVAEEMGKLSKLSKESADNIDKSLMTMKKAYGTITDEIEIIRSDSETQAKFTHEVSSKINETNRSFSSLIDFLNDD